VDQTNTTRRMKINYSHTLRGLDKDLTRAGMDGELPRVKERECLLALHSFSDAMLLLFLVSIPNQSGVRQR